MKIKSICIPCGLALCLASILGVTGCANIPAAVKISVDNVRTNVEALHEIHARDVRAVANAECVLRDDGQSVRQAFRESMEAKIDVSKTRIMAEYDRRAGYVLGSEFQTKLQTEIYPKFVELERTNFHALAQALEKKVTNPNSLGVSENVLAAQQDLDNVRYERDAAISTYFTALSSALQRDRFNFETKIGLAYLPVESNVLAVISSLEATHHDLAAFDTNMDTCMAQLDDAYNQIDQALSDLSTDLDSSAVTTRMVKSYFTGVGSALVDDLKNGQLGAAAMSQLLSQQAPGLVKEINSIEGKMLTAAGQSVTNTANSVSSTTLNASAKNN